MTEWERFQHREDAHRVDANAVLQILVSTQNIFIVNKAIMDTVSRTIHVAIMPQKQDAVKSVLVHMYNTWFEDRASIVIDQVPKSTIGLVDKLNKKAVKFASTNVINNYHFNAAFRHDQTNLPALMDHPQNMSNAGTSITRSGYEHL